MPTLRLSDVLRGLWCLRRTTNHLGLLSPFPFTQPCTIAASVDLSNHAAFHVLRAGNASESLLVVLSIISGLRYELPFFSLCLTGFGS
jgi:hypothetical protein